MNQGAINVLEGLPRPVGFCPCYFQGTFIDNDLTQAKSHFCLLQRDKQEVYNGPIMSSKVVWWKVITLERGTEKKTCAKSQVTKSQHGSKPSLGRANLVLIDVTLSTRAKYRLARRHHAAAAAAGENVNK